LSYSSSISSSHFRNTLSFQALPNVSGSFRYTGVGDKDVKFKSSSGYAYWDRSFDLRVLINKENTVIPALTLGFQDFVGTGNYSSEYVVASKSFFQNFQSSLGLGWGGMGKREAFKGFGDSGIWGAEVGVGAESVNVVFLIGIYIYI